MGPIGLAFTLSKVLVGPALKAVGGLALNDRRVVAMLNKAGFETLNDTFESVYTHSLVEMATDFCPQQAISFFSEPQVVDLVRATWAGDGPRLDTSLLEMLRQSHKSDGLLATDPPWTLSEVIKWFTETFRKTAHTARSPGQQETWIENRAQTRSLARIEARQHEHDAALTVIKAALFDREAVPRHVNGLARELQDRKTLISGHVVDQAPRETSIVKRLLTSPTTLLPHTDLELLTATLAREIKQSLHAVDIFSTNWEKALVTAAKQDDYFCSLAGAHASLRAPVDRELPRGALLGQSPNSDVLREELQRRQTTIALHPALSGALGIFTYLRLIEHLPIRINMAFAYSDEITTRIRANTLSDVATACVLPAAASAAMFSKVNPSVLALMPMPGTSHRILGVRNKRSSNLVSAMGLVNDQPTSARMLLEGLKRQNGLDRRALIHVPHDDAFSTVAQANGEIESISWFPNFWLAERYAGLQVRDPGCSTSMHNHAWIFVCQDHCDRPQYLQSLDIAIRNAWMTLRDSQDLAQIIARDIVMRTDYVKIALRYAGVSVSAKHVER